MRSTAPRIYNLHPLLAGPIERWPDHLPRIVAMGFDWVYVNAFFEPGASGSIYAVRDPWQLHPTVRGGATGDSATLVRAFTEKAHEGGLAVMFDLIVPHVAQDSRLAEEHPDWLRRGPDGGVVAPTLANPTDPRHPRHMDDLAEIELTDERHRAAQLDYFAALAAHFLELGAAGFRCSAAYKVPPAFWRELIGKIRRRHPHSVFLAAALGCPFEQVRGLAGCGFDLIFDSSRWWDFHGGWFLDQHEELRRIAPTVAFPEDHNTPRLAEAFDTHEPADMARLYRARWLISSFIGTGVLMPMGYEFGCRRRLDPVHTSPEQWQAETREPAIDLQDFIAAANATRRDSGVLQVPGPLRRVSAPNARIVALLRFDAGAPPAASEAALAVINPDQVRPDGLEFGPMLTAAGGRIDGFTDVTPDIAPMPFVVGTPVTLDPLGVRIFLGRAARKEGLAAVPAASTSEARLSALAPDRVAIERVTPELDGGRFPVKRVVGEVLTVEADIFCDGHEKIAAEVRYRPLGEKSWAGVRMEFVDNDRWAGSFPLTRNTRYVYTIEAWRDLFATWRVEITKKHDAGQRIEVELGEGRHLVDQAIEEAHGPDEEALRDLARRLDACGEDQGRLLALLLGGDVQDLMARAGPRANLSRYGRELEVWVDRTAGAFAAWYEIFPRSMSDDPNRHGTFDDVIRKMPYVREMGFDVLYFPPIHPIGRRNRKGRNNSLTAQPGDPGSPYAIGAEEGGHDALHPELGSFDDFARMVEAAHGQGLEIAIDFAIQCSPDHPWIREHPEWFDWRPDGTIKYAENPPKKYEDIVNVRFYGASFPSLWYALRDVVLFWCERGVKIFRVDNPHTKPLPFWEWMIREVQDRHPDAIFLSEAFTRPKMMKRLAKVGFTQSYSYFTWRNTKAELTEYLTELTQDEPREHMRPNFFVNTPDINPVYLQTSGRPGFRVRAVLASLLSPLWGVYSGFELCEGRPIPGKEEYLDSEKYEIKAWDWDRPGNIRGDVALLNRVRRENPALWQFANLRFHEAWNDHVLVFSKMTEALDNAVLVAINLDPHQAQGCQIELPLWRFGLGDHASIAVEDLLTGRRFAWTGKVQHVWLDPHVNPFAIWRLVPPGLPA